MKRLLRVWSGSLILFALLLSPLVPAQEPLTVEWHRVEFAPTFILAGAARDQGFGDALLRALISRLPQYRHLMVNAPLERALDRTSTSTSTRLACAVALLLTPQREQHIHFSNPFLYTSTNGTLIRAADYRRFEPFLRDGRLSLGQVLQTRAFTLGIAHKRSYGPSLNALIAQHAGQPYLIEKGGQGSTLSLLSTLSKQQQHVDLVLAYPLEAAYWLKTSRSPVPLHFLPLTEAAAREEWRVGCSRTPQGEQLITAINALVTDPAFRQSYLSSHAQWQAQLSGILRGAPTPSEIPQP